MCAYMCVHVCVCLMYMYVCVPTESWLELQAIVTHLTWVLRIELRSFAWTVHTLNH